ncbi:MAG: single-stranded DNA-binding protein [Nocardioides sp.]
MKSEPPSSPERLNQVSLIGHLAAESELRELPSGDSLRLFRVNVRRDPGATSRQTVDSLECVAWNGRVKRSVASWRPGDLVEVGGGLRRRFFRSASGSTASRVEVEVTEGRLLRRGTTE